MANDVNLEDRERIARSVSAAVCNAFAVERSTGRGGRSNAAIRRISAIYTCLPYGTVAWIFDTGADVHVTNNFALLGNVRHVNEPLGGYNGTTSIVHYVGEITLTLADQQI